MIEKNNVDLSKMTTMHIGGQAKRMLVPESEQEVLDIVKKFKYGEYHIISGGSNLLINDARVFELVISMEKADNEIKQLKDNIFYVGCSNRIQKVIKEINNYGYGGFEELYSLPAMFGGIIYMNAGIGSKTNPLFMISDFIVRVKAVDISTQNVVWLTKDECMFSHRNSIFQNNKYIILGAEVELNKQDAQVSKKRIKDRISKCSKEYEWGKGCFGTCFSTANRKLLKIVDLLNIGNRRVYQPKNNSNWLVNNGNGKYKDAMKIINKAEYIHKIMGKEIKREVIIWR